MLRKRWILPLVLILILVTGCTNNNPPQDNSNQDNEQGEEENQNNQDNQEESNENQETSQEDEPEAGQVTVEDAFDAFTEKYPGIKVQKVELDKSDGEYLYKVKGYDGTKKYKIRLYLENGAMETEEKQDDDIVDGEITKEDLGKVQEFLDKALAHAGNDYKIYEWELKAKRGQIIIDIEVIDETGDEIEYEYDVGTGELIEKDD